LVVPYPFRRDVDADTDDAVDVIDSNPRAYDVDIIAYPSRRRRRESRLRRRESSVDASLKVESYLRVHTHAERENCRRTLDFERW
jgi:hypothetical protein